MTFGDNDYGQKKQTLRYLRSLGKSQSIYYEDLDLEKLSTKEIPVCLHCYKLIDMYKKRHHTITFLTSYTTKYIDPINFVNKDALEAKEILDAKMRHCADNYLNSPDKEILDLLKFKEVGSWDKSDMDFLVGLYKR